MNSDDPQADAWLDARLRAVPLPSGMLERLRAIAQPEAGEVPEVCDPQPADPPLERSLKNVPVPPGLVPNLKAVVWEDDEFLDTALQDVPIPEELWSRVRRIPLGVRRPAPLYAALVAMVVGGVWLAYSAAGGQFAARHALAARQATLPAWDLLVELPADRPPAETAAFAAPPIVRPRGELSDYGPLEIEVPLVDVAAAPDRWARVSRGVTPWWLPGSASPPLDPLLDATRYRWPVFGSHGSFDDLPELRKVAGLAPRGVRVPVVPGFDLPFFIRTGVHPFVNPAAHAQLQTSTVPLATDRSSFELTRRFLQDGELPPSSAVRTEEFLAAIDYAYPRPKSEPLALHAAAGPSPYRGDPRRMLHVGVQAQDLARAKRAPVHLTLLIDASASMAWGGRLEIVQRALRTLEAQLDPHDRLNLISFNDQPCVHGEDVRREQMGQAADVLGRLRPQGPTNVGAALREGFVLARRGAWQPGMARHVVLLSDGLAELDAASAELIGQRVADAARLGVKLDLIDLNPSLEDVSDQQLGGLCRAGRGRVHRATDVDQVRWALGEIVSGQSQRVAREVKLQVTFNPAAVVEYRLLGHEAAAVAGLLPAPETCDFFSGQSGTALYELVLRPGPVQEVASIELSWRDARGGPLRNFSRTVLRSQFAAGLGQTPLWFQAGAFAAEFGELLRDSPLVRSGPLPGSWGLLLESLNFVDSRLQAQPTVADCIALARKAEKIKPAVRGGRR